MKHMVIGQSIPRADAVEKVQGKALYPGDIDREGQLYMKILFADRPHARIVSVDASEAEAMPGVVAVFTAKDVPHNAYGLMESDQPVLCGPGSGIPGADVVRCVADQIALVVAESEAVADRARALIKVEYEDLPAVFDPFEAMQPGAYPIHADPADNVLCDYHIRRGDVEAAFERADVVVEATYTTTWQEHAYLQPEAGVSYIDEAGRVTVVTAGQWAHEDRAQISHALGLSPDEIRVMYANIGGAFGGREDMSVQIVLALAAWKLGRPIKITWDRPESIRGHHKRHPVTVKAKWGATRAGNIIAAEAEIVGDAGAYHYTTSKVLGNSTLLVTGPYEIPNVKVDTFGVYTNNLPSGAFRGFGAPQANFAAEGQINRLAEALNRDPVTLRLQNAFREGSIMSVGTPVPPGVSVVEVVERCAEESYWARSGGVWEFAGGSGIENDSAQHAGPAIPGARVRGVGFACGYKNVGFSFGHPERSWARVEIHGHAGEMDRVVVRHAGAECGQGAHSAMIQFAADTVGVPVEKVRLIGHDTAETQDSGSASASRMTFMAGHAIQGAAREALFAWERGEVPAEGVYVYRPQETSPFAPQTGQCMPNFAYGYMAQAVEVEVDLETGLIDVIQVVSVDDVGKAVNPQQIEGQIEGGVVQAQGYALLEHLKMQGGQVMNPYFSTYLIPTILDIPRDVRPVIVEHPDPRGPGGVRGVGEMPFIPLAAAIVAAVRDATGIWFDDLPLYPDRVVSRLREAGLGEIG